MNNIDLVLVTHLFDKAQAVFGYTEAALERLNVGNYFLKNLLPVTLGNLIGGMLFVGVVYYVVYGRNSAENRQKMAAK